MAERSTDNLLAILAENIRTFRRQKGFSQEALAEECGLHRTYIGSLERQERNVSLRTLEILGKGLGMSVPDLLTRHRSPEFQETEALGRHNSDLIDAFTKLSHAQRVWVAAVIRAFVEATCRFERAPDSDLVTESVLAAIGDRLITHHLSSREALSKGRFEFAFESALNSSGISAQLVSSRTNPGHDITISGVPTSLKTEAAANIKDETLHISKWMELGQGEWNLNLLRDLFLNHLTKYDRILTFRRLREKDEMIRYELVEIPKVLLLEAANCQLEIRTESKQKPQPGYGHVLTQDGELKYSLYFDGGTERKLQIKHLRKEFCKIHATWEFCLPSTQ